VPIFYFIAKKWVMVNEGKLKESVKKLVKMIKFEQSIKTIVIVVALLVNVLGIIMAIIDLYAFAIVVGVLDVFLAGDIYASMPYRPKIDEFQIKIIED
jgi:hypothetical protein